MLEDLPTAQRELGLDLLRATLSSRGFTQARDIMRLNEVLAQASGSHDEFGEWPYLISIFGTPSPDEPWGWQYDGHHIAVNCMVFGDEMVLTPTFMGSEPCKVTSGPFAGIEVFGPEQQVGLDLIRSLDAKQHETAVLYPSIMPGTLPKHLEHSVGAATTTRPCAPQTSTPTSMRRGSRGSAVRATKIRSTTASIARSC
jgi:hypothetical protein